MAAKPKLAVFKFASCDGCQLSLLDCEDELPAVVGEIEIANFLEASREVQKGPYDLVLVEGSITTSHDAERIQQVRKQARFLVTIGACATAGGIHSLPVASAFSATVASRASGKRCNSIRRSDITRRKTNRARCISPPPSRR